MNGLWILFILIAASALPAILIIIWLRIRKFPITYSWIFLALLMGALSLFIAAVIQTHIPQSNQSTIGALLFKIFIQIALTEEAGRLIVLSVFFALARRILKNNDAYTPEFSAATGMLAGFCFAVIETALYSSVDFPLIFVRAITAAPLHGACGARIGIAAAGIINKKPSQFLSRFLSAIIIHGMYNFMLVSPGFPVLIPILIVLSAFVSSLLGIRSQVE